MCYESTSEASGVDGTEESNDGSEEEAGNDNDDLDEWAADIEQDLVVSSAVSVSTLHNQASGTGI